MIPITRRSTVLLFLVPILLIFTGCSSVYVPYPVENRDAENSSHGEDTALSRIFNKVCTEHPELSGAYLLDKGEDALLWKGALVDKAQKSIDIQTFIWKDDNVGTIGAAHLLMAAQRGVRIRILLDYLTLDVDSKYLLLLNDHPNVSIRLYNPYPGLDANLGLKVAAGSMASFSRFNRRMHNKIFLVDGEVMLIGGRNNADEYYDMHSEMNFRDRELMVVGAILPEVREGFDIYWNSDWAVDLQQIKPTSIDSRERSIYYQELKSYAQNPENFPPRFNVAMAQIGESLENLPEELAWGAAAIAYDIPGKNEKLMSLRGFSKTGDFLTHSFLKAKKEVLVETPYMITMPGTIDLFASMTERGVEIQVLTDSMASAEDDLVFSAYKQQRRKILKSGVTLYELRPDAALRNTVFNRFAEMEEMPLISLHAKTAVIDQRTLLIGSFNLDPRSTHINTEHVFSIESPELARQVGDIIKSDMNLENCWQVSMDSEGALTWKTLRNGVEDISKTEPNVPLWERIRLLFFLMLPMNPVL